MQEYVSRVSYFVFTCGEKFKKNVKTGRQHLMLIHSVPPPLSCFVWDRQADVPSSSIFKGGSEELGDGLIDKMLATQP